MHACRSTLEDPTSLIGGATGLLAGYLGSQALIALAGDQVPGTTTTTLHVPVLLFTLVLALATGMIFGVMPAIAVIRGNTSSMLKEDATRGSAGRRTGALRAALVVGETAVAVMLLVGAGLLIKSFANLRGVNPGFNADNVLTAQISLPASRYPDAAARWSFWQRLTEKARQIPGATSVGLASGIPLSGNVSSGSYSIVGYTPGPSEARPHARQDVVGADYFQVMQIPLIEGRLFNDGDTPDSPPVAIVDQLLVDKYFKGRSAVGQEITRGGPPIRIVGVVGTINSIDLAEPVAKERIYRPASQATGGGMALVVKAGLEPSQLVSQVRAAVQSIDPEQPIAQIRTMEEWVDRSLGVRRAPMMLLTIFGAVALVLSSIGIYGVLAYGVTQRVREFGIRQALGADRTSILSLVLKQGLARVAIGLALGIAGGLALSTYLESMLFGVSAGDPTVFVAVAVLLFAVAIAACYIPARRATRIDPMIALRDA